MRQNLLCALRTLRAERSGPIWIDALCINQADDTERGHQVEMMGSVYKQAKPVLIWLGTPDVRELRDEHLDVVASYPETIPVPAFRFLAEAEANIDAYLTPEQSLGQRIVTSLGFRESTKPRPSELFELDSHSWSQLELICSLPYWNRMWITQEVCLSRELKVSYGRDMFAWNDFKSFRYKFIYADIKDNQTVNILKKLRETQPFKLDATRSRLSHQPGISLKEALELTLKCSCQDRRDKVYGILGLVADWTEGGIRRYDISLKEGVLPVRYDISLRELYRNVMAQYSSWEQNYTTELRSKHYELGYALQRTLLEPYFNDAFENQIPIDTIRRWEEIIARGERRDTARAKQVARL